jgi:hypothetical protein
MWPGKAKLQLAAKLQSKIGKQTSQTEPFSLEVSLWRPTKYVELLGKVLPYVVECPERRSEENLFSERRPEDLRMNISLMEM